LIPRPDHEPSYRAEIRREAAARQAEHDARVRRVRFELEERGAEGATVREIAQALTPRHSFLMVDPWARALQELADSGEAHRDGDVWRRGKAPPAGGVTPAAGGPTPETGATSGPTSGGWPCGEQGTAQPIQTDEDTMNSGPNADTVELRRKMLAWLTENPGQPATAMGAAIGWSGTSAGIQWHMNRMEAEKLVRRTGTRNQTRWYVTAKGRTASPVASPPPVETELASTDSGAAEASYSSSGGDDARLNDAPPVGARPEGAQPAEAEAELERLLGDAPLTTPEEAAAWEREKAEAAADAYGEALAKLGWEWSPGSEPGGGTFVDVHNGAVRVARAWGPDWTDRRVWTYFHDQSRAFDSATECVLWVAAGCPAPASAASPTAPATTAQAQPAPAEEPAAGRGGTFPTLEAVVKAAYLAGLAQAHDIVGDLRTDGAGEESFAVEALGSIDGAIKYASAEDWTPAEGLWRLKFVLSEAAKGAAPDPRDARIAELERELAAAQRDLTQSRAIATGEPYCLVGDGYPTARAVLDGMVRASIAIQRATDQRDEARASLADANRELATRGELLRRVSAAAGDPAMMWSEAVARVEAASRRFPGLACPECAETERSRDEARAERDKACADLHEISALVSGRTFVIDPERHPVARMVLDWMTADGRETGAAIAKVATERDEARRDRSEALRARDEALNRARFAEKNLRDALEMGVGLARLAQGESARAAAK
jgi:hypothetical protein